VGKYKRKFNTNLDMSGVGKYKYKFNKNLDMSGGSVFFFAGLKCEKGEIVLVKGGNPKSLSAKAKNWLRPSMSSKKAPKFFACGAEKTPQKFSPAALLKKKVQKHE